MSSPASSPAKKRKLNNGGKTSSAPAKSLEYFFSKQNSIASSKLKIASENLELGSNDVPQLTDEELARKLQAEWDEEDARDRLNNGPPSQATSENPEVKQDEHTPKPASSRPDEDTGSPETGHQPPVIPSSAFVVDDANTKPKRLALQSTGIAEDAIMATIPFDQPALTFEPSKYVDQLRNHWAKEGGDASYALLTRCFVLVSATQSRIKIVDTLVNCLRVLIEGDSSSLLSAVCCQPAVIGTALTITRCG